MAPNPSILLAQGVGLRKRAEGLAVRAEHPFTRDQIELISLAARDAMDWLRDPEASRRPGHLESIVESLRVLAERLDQIEDLLRHQGPAGSVPAARPAAG